MARQRPLGHLSIDLKETSMVFWGEMISYFAKQAITASKGVSSNVYCVGLRLNVYEEIWTFLMGTWNETHVFLPLSLPRWPYSCKSWSRLDGRDDKVPTGFAHWPQRTRPVFGSTKWMTSNVFMLAHSKVTTRLWYVCDVYLQFSIFTQVRQSQH